MSKEELEKEADSWGFKKKYTYGYSYTYAQVKNAYICGAEPREKRIAELEKEKFTLRNERNTFLAQNEQYEKDLIDCNENLTKAKDLVLRLSTCLEGHSNNNFEYELIKEAEQFIKE